MERTRSWTDPRDGKLWMLIRGLGMEVIFTRGTEQRTVLLDHQAELSSFTDQEIEALLDQAQRVHRTDD